MKQIFSQIQNIQRPKILMNAAKELASSSLKKGDMAQILDAKDLENLILRESEAEKARRVQFWQYRSEEHIALLAQLIRQTALFSNKSIH